MTLNASVPCGAPPFGFNPAPRPLPSVAQLPRKVYAPTRGVPQQARQPGRRHTPTDDSLPGQTVSTMALTAVEKARVIDMMADDLADAIWADLQGDCEAYGSLPDRNAPKQTKGGRR